MTMTDQKPPVWPDQWLWTLLKQRNLLTESEMITVMRQPSSTCWDACVKADVLSDDEILAAVSNRCRIAVTDPSVLDSEVRKLIPEEFAREHQIVPIRLDGRILEVACVNPVTQDVETLAGFKSGRRVRLTLASPAQLQALMDRLYPRRDAIESLVRELRRETEGAVLRASGERESSDPAVPVVKLVDAVVAQAIAQRASDLHIEPEESGIVVRCRIDGAMVDLQRLPRSVGPALVSRLKIMAELDISDRLRPQDGRANAVVQGRSVALRVSTMPVGHLGEKVVIRILDGSASAPSLNSLGFSQPELNRIERVLRGDEGLFLVSGPTGSGKTTTLYSILRALQSSSVNIVTVEDPIEYRLEGVTQVQVHEKAGLTFANVLRSMMRQDPDVLLVGEIRDADTANIALQASMTGHRVLSTVHTPDAPSVISRLLGIGAEPTALAQSLKGIVAQRLVRRTCTKCRVPVNVEDLPRRQRQLLENTPITQLNKAVGCPACNNTGYYGRTVVAEVVVITHTIGRAIAANASPAEIWELCRAAGMRTLWESGLDRVATGETTLDELLDTVAPPMPDDDTQHAQQDADQEEDVAPEVNEFLASLSGDGAAQIANVAIDVASGAKQRCVLIADDEENIRKVFRIGLERAGYRVVEAEDGVAALARASADIDAIVLDLNLPLLDGFGVLNSMAATGRAGVPVLVVTGQHDPEIAQWALDAGAADIVTKPISPRALAEKINDMLNRVTA